MNILYKALTITLEILLHILICCCLSSQGPKMKDSATASTPKAKQPTVLHSSKLCFPLNQQQTSVASTVTRYVLQLCLPDKQSFSYNKLNYCTLKSHGNIAFNLVTITSSFAILFTCIYVW